jgi:hypothetical protein
MTAFRQVDSVKRNQHVEEPLDGGESQPSSMPAKMWVLTVEIRGLWDLEGVRPERVVLDRVRFRRMP